MPDTGTFLQAWGSLSAGAGPVAPAVGLACTSWCLEVVSPARSLQVTTSGIQVLGWLFGVELFLSGWSPPLDASSVAVMRCV